MPRRMSIQEQQQALIDALPADGSAIPYAQLVDTLDQRGQSEAREQYLTLLREGRILGVVSFDELGGNRQHTVSRA